MKRTSIIDHFAMRVLTAIVLLCTIGAGSVLGTEVSTTMQSVVEANDYEVSVGQTIGTKCLSIDLDANINISINSGSNSSNNGTFWGTGASINWRGYQAQSGTYTLTAKNGCTLSSVTFTFSTDKGGTLNTSGNGNSIAAGYRLTSGTALSLSGTSKTLYVGNTNSSGDNLNKGQVRITAISVTYSAGAGCSGTQLEMTTVTATPSDGQVVLSWDAVSNATKYQVKWNGGSWTDVNTNSYTKSSLTNGTEYSYQVKAIGNGTTYCDSDPTSSASITAGPRYTVSFDVGTGTSSVASVTESDYEAGIKWPAGPTSGAASDGWVFAGWAEEEIENATIAPILRMPGDYYYPTSDKTFYAVYRKLRGGKSTATFTASDVSNLTQVSSDTYGPAWYRHKATNIEFYIEDYGIYSGTWDIDNTVNNGDGWAIIDAHSKIESIAMTVSSGYAVDDIDSDAGSVELSTNGTSQTISCTGDVTQVYLYAADEGESRITTFTVTYYNAKYQTNPTVCATAPNVGTPTLTSLSGGKISVNCPSISANGCTISDYGFVWVSGGSDPTIGNNKTQVGTEDRSTAFEKENLLSYSAGTTYKIKAYAINEYATTLSSTLTVIPRSVTFNLNGHGSSTPSTQYVADGEKATDPSYSESVSGYTFLGWNTADDGKGTDWDFSTNTVSGANVTLYAKWCKKYSVSLTSSGSVAGGTFDADPKSACEGTDITLGAFPSTGYEFSSWTVTNDDDDDADVTTTVLGSSNVNVDAVEFDMPAYDITINATFSPKEYNIIYYDGGETDAIPFSGVHGDNHPTTHTYATATALVSPTKTGYTFGGWYSSKACTGDAITSLGATSYTADITLYAKWTAISYSVRFNKNDDNATGSMDNQAFTYDVAQALTSCGFTKTGCYIKGWATTNDGDVAYTNGQSVSNLSSTNEAIVDLYAVWGFYEKYVFSCVDISVSLEDSKKVLVTSRNGINIMAVNKLLVTTEGAVDGHIVDFSNGAGLKFYKKVDGVYKDLSVVANKLVTPLTNQEVYVSYAPTSAGTGAITTPEFTISCEGFTQTFNNSGEYVKVRNLPDAVAIVANVGGSWHGLSANITSSSTPKDTMIAVATDGGLLKAYGPSTNFAYKLWPVKTTTGSADRFGTGSGATVAYGDRLRFAGKDNKGLLANNNSSSNLYNINNSGTINSIDANFTNDENYEWKVTTREVDGQFVYTFQTDQTNNTRYLRLWNGRWGTYQDGKGTEDVYLLPIVETALVDMQPYEWGSDQVVVYYSPSATPVALTGVNVGSDAAASPTFAQIGSSDLWRVSGLTGLTSKPAQQLQIQITENAVAKQGLLQIPLIVNGNSTESELRNSLTGANMTEKNKVAKNTDVVILRGGKLTTGTASGNFKDLYIYAGGKAIITYAMSFGSIYMRGGFGYIGAETWDVPRAKIDAAVTLAEGGALYYDLTMDATKYYDLAVPYEVDLTAATDDKGDDDFNVWLKIYDGAKRAGDTRKGWDWYNWDGDLKLHPGTGYLIEATPRYNRPYCTVRFPMNPDLSSGEAHKEAVEVTAHGITKGTIDQGKTPNNVGWNFIANPYLCNFGVGESVENIDEDPDDILQIGELELGDDGKYTWNTEGAVRYVTTFDFASQHYEQRALEGVVLAPFTGFFIQVGDDGTLDFTMEGRQLSAPALRNNSMPRDMEIAIKLAGNGQTDETRLHINDDLTIVNPLEFPEENTKQMNANYVNIYTYSDQVSMYANGLSYDESENWNDMGVVAPSDGEYTFSIKKVNRNYVNGVLILDKTTSVAYNLLDGDVTLQLPAGTINGRFAVKIQYGPATTTDFEGNGEAEHTNPEKFIYDDKMFIRCKGVLYDATGKKVRKEGK